MCSVWFKANVCLVHFTKFYGNLLDQTLILPLGSFHIHI